MRRDDGGRRVGGNGDSVRGGKGLRGVELVGGDREQWVEREIVVEVELWNPSKREGREMREERE